MFVVFRLGADLPAAGDLAQLQSARPLGVIVDQRLDCLAYAALIDFENICNCLYVDWFFGNEDQCFGNCFQLGRRNLALTLISETVSIISAPSSAAAAAFAFS